MRVSDRRRGGAASRTLLHAVLQVIRDGGQDGGEIHRLCALRQAEREQLAPTEAHQLRLYLTAVTRTRPIDGETA